MIEDIGIVWLVLLVAFAAAIGHAVEKWDSGWGALGITAILGTCIWFFGDREFILSPSRFVRDHPLATLLWTIGYVAVGIAWSMLRWVIFLKKELAQDKRNHDLYHKDEQFAPYVPKANDHRDTIAMWTAWWPFSLLRTLVGDLLFGLFRNIFYALERFYDKLARSIMRS